MVLYHLIEIVVDILHDVIVSIITYGILHNRIEDVLLLRRRNRSPSAKHGLNKFRLKILWLFSEVKHIVDICISLYKCREKKSLNRSFYNPVSVPLLDDIFRLIVSKPCLGELDRANTAENVVIDVV